MGQGVCWCGGRDRFSLALGDGPREVDVVDASSPASPVSGVSSAHASANPTQTSRRAMDNKAGQPKVRVKSESIFAQTRLTLSRRASTEEADTRWKATKEEWERSVRAALEAQSLGAAAAELQRGDEKALSQEDERRAALAMFKTVATPEDGEHRSQQERSEVGCTDALQGADGAGVPPVVVMLDGEAGVDIEKGEEHPDESPTAASMEGGSPSSMAVNHEDQGEVLTSSISKQEQQQLSPSKGLDLREEGEAADGRLERCVRSAGGA